MHQDHDRSLIAGMAADDLAPSDRTRAQALLDSCSECSALRADLLTIIGATRALPPARAPRDFRITAEQAARLRRTGWAARLLAPFSGARSPARPLATTFATLGLVGVFVAAALPGMFGGAAMTAIPEGVGAGSGIAGAPGPAATAAPAPQFGPAVASAAPGDAGYGTKDNVEASAAPLTGQSGGGDNRDLGSGDTERVDAPTPTNLLLVGSIGFLAIGLLLFGLSVVGRRLR